jgi:protein-tyrosine phosphatase
MAKRVLFVCLGNICRSPLAEGFLRARAEEAGVAVDVDSAGTTGFHLDDPPDPRAVVAARVHGVDIAGQTARKLRRDDYSAFDLLIAMDEQILAEMIEKQPEGARTPIILFTDFIPGDGPKDVPDPYYSSQFDPVIEMIEAAIPALLAQACEAQ